MLRSRFKRPQKPLNPPRIEAAAQTIRYAPQNLFHHGFAGRASLGPQGRIHTIPEKTCPKRWALPLKQKARLIYSRASQQHQIGGPPRVSRDRHAGGMPQRRERVGRMPTLAFRAEHGLRSAKANRRFESLLSLKQKSPTEYQSGDHKHQIGGPPRVSGDRHAAAPRTGGQEPTPDFRAEHGLRSAKANRRFESLHYPKEKASSTAGLFTNALLIWWAAKDSNLEPTD